MILGALKSAWGSYVDFTNGVAKGGWETVGEPVVALAKMSVGGYVDGYKFAKELASDPALRSQTKADIVAATDTAFNAAKSSAKAVAAYGAAATHDPGKPLRDATQATLVGWTAAKQGGSAFMASENERYAQAKANGTTAGYWGEMTGRAIGTVATLANVGALSKAGLLAKGARVAEGASAAAKAEAIVARGASGLRAGYEVLPCGKIVKIAAASHPLAGKSVAQVVSQAKNMGLVAPPNATLLWSGLGNKGASIAEQTAKELGATTLEMTSGGKWLTENLLTKVDNIPFNQVEVRQIFNQASDLYASGAKGQVKALLGKVRPTSTFATIELPAILSNPLVSTFQKITFIQ